LARTEPASQDSELARAGAIWRQRAKKGVTLNDPAPRDLGAGQHSAPKKPPNGAWGKAQVSSQILDREEIRQQQVGVFHQ
jgi:hypothetical protein